jgi:hypothetical protein
MHRVANQFLSEVARVAPGLAAPPGAAVAEKKELVEYAT